MTTGEFLGSDCTHCSSSLGTTFFARSDLLNSGMEMHALLLFQSPLPGLNSQSGVDWEGETFVSNQRGSDLMLLRAANCTHTHFIKVPIF